MSGLGEVSENGGATFLSIAGGFIWDRKASESDKNYATQDYEKADKSTGTRKGARYASLTGKVVGVQFKTHAEYGESINITFEAGGERYIISISTNNRYSQDAMKALLVMNTDEIITMKPYDFIGSDKKRAQGISFTQNGEKLSLKVDNAPTKDAEWFKSADKKSIKRFFEDLNDWFVAEVEEVVTPRFGPLEPLEKKAETPKTEAPVAPSGPATEKVLAESNTPKVEAQPETVGVTSLKMKKALRDYISENYPGKELPSLEKEDLVKWYNLSLQEEELPFDESTPVAEAEVSQSDIDAQLSALMGE